ncbi:MAG: hypothetical protein LBI15_11780 [Dysgonamonadaceae bacterium]|jgi:hypothetical protein|nr:hypothetical protein [Dysgonamonadaceae bacterium]
MKTKFFMAILAVAMIFSACNTENEIDNGEKSLTIRVSKVESRAIQAPTNPGAVHGDNIATAITTGTIFLIAPNGSVTQRVALNLSGGSNDANGTGQVINNVPSNTRVFIVGNVPAAANTQLQAATTWTAIQTVVTAVTDITGLMYTDAPLANASGVPNSPLPAGTDLVAEVGISPVYARLELFNVTGGDFVYNTTNATRITNFNVVGIYVDEYLPNFNYIGGGTGVMNEINQDRIADPAYSGSWTGLNDVTDGPWAGVGSTTVRPVAAPASGNVWAYNLAAGARSRLVIAVRDITYSVTSNYGTDGSTATWTAGSNSLNDGVIRYLTIGSYNGAGNNPFTRAIVYRIAPGALTFNTNQVHDDPNPITSNLTVTIDLLPWTVNLLTPELR